VKGRAFSVVICTFNGAARIEPVLTALAGLNGGAGHEIVLVDNCSTDGVAAIASAIWTQVGRPAIDFRVISETTQGLSAARRAGVRAATREIVVFCDDDNLLSSDYLEVAPPILADQPIGATGGPNPQAAASSLNMFTTTTLSRISLRALLQSPQIFHIGT